MPVSINVTLQQTYNVTISLSGNVTSLLVQPRPGLDQVLALGGGSRLRVHRRDTYCERRPRSAAQAVSGQHREGDDCRVSRRADSQGDLQLRI
jgi:hypothetical protein